MEQLAPHRALTYIVVKDLKDEFSFITESLQHIEYLSEIGISSHTCYIDQGQRGKGWDMLEKHLKDSKNEFGLVLVTSFDHLSKDVGWILLKQAELEEKYGISIYSVRESQLGVDQEKGLSFE